MIIFEMSNFLNPFVSGSGLLHKISLVLSVTQKKVRILFRKKNTVD